MAAVIIAIAVYVSKRRPIALDTDDVDDIDRGDGIDDVDGAATDPEVQTAPTA